MRVINLIRILQFARRSLKDSPLIKIEYQPSLVFTFMNRKKGFSLLELVLVMSLVSILYLTILPSYHFLATGSQQKILSAELLRAINLARNEALVRRVSSRLYLQERSFKIKVEDQDFLTFQSNAAGILHWRFFPRYHDTFEFLPTGHMTVDNGTIWYCDNHKLEWFVVINKSGRARLVRMDNLSHHHAADPKDLNCS